MSNGWCYNINNINFFVYQFFEGIKNPDSEFPGNCFSIYFIGIKKNYKPPGNLITFND